MDVHLRTARLGDYNAVCTLFGEVDAYKYHSAALPHIFRMTEGLARTREWFTDVLASDHAAFFVAEHEGEVVGCLHVTLHDVTDLVPILTRRRYAMIQTVVVSTKVRRQGLGHQLMDRAERWAEGCMPRSREGSAG